MRDPLAAELAGLLATVSANPASQLRNREFILTHERAADKAAILDGIYCQLARRSAPTSNATSH